MRHTGILRAIFSLCFWTTRTSSGIWASVWRSTDDGNAALTNSSQQLVRFLHVTNAARSASSADGESPGASKMIRVWQVPVLRLEMSVWGVSVWLQAERMNFTSFPRKNTAMKMETSIRNSVWTSAWSSPARELLTFRQRWRTFCVYKEDFSMLASTSGRSEVLDMCVRDSIPMTADVNKYWAYFTPPTSILVFNFWGAAPNQNKDHSLCSYAGTKTRIKCFFICMEICFRGV